MSEAAANGIAAVVSLAASASLIAARRARQTGKHDLSDPIHPDADAPQAPDQHRRRCVANGSETSLRERFNACTGAAMR
eukprot:366209-Chlamydomonas_euryale.AAC.9